MERAIAQPNDIRKLYEYLRSRGIQKTLGKVVGRIRDTKTQSGSATPLGYSCSGRVVAIGDGVTDLKPGEAVACAGAGAANHAEIVLVPRQLVARVPEGCSLRDASSVALGAIAMQGVRRAEVKLGEVVCLLGLGLLGQIALQLLTASGCRVIGFDLDPRRVALAKQLGAEAAYEVDSINIATEVGHRTNGHGADATIIAAATKSNAVIKQAMDATRKKGRIVIIGAVGLGLERSPFYEKELDLLMSCSYGPGRYDAMYEARGLDYPYAYVRWTERRNMEEYLRLLAAQRVCLDNIIEREFPIEEVPQAYAELSSGDPRPLAVALRYSPTAEPPPNQKLATRMPLRAGRPDGRIGLAVIGAGNFAAAVHLPNLARLSDTYYLRAVVSASGSKAKATAERFGADYASTSYEDVLRDSAIDAVLITTRHNLHAQIAAQAAEAGKAILLEKPMATTQADLDMLTGVLERTKVPFMVGFNRRFSPAARRAKELLFDRPTPLMLLYRVNAGHLPADHWVRGSEGGGRIIGEACHMVDLFQFLVGSPVIGISSEFLGTPSGPGDQADEAVITLQYRDGSVASLAYTALGASELPKEYVEMHFAGKTLIINDYSSLIVYGAKHRGWSSSVQDKGHLHELVEFAKAVRGAAPWPIPLHSMVETTKVTFAAVAEIGQSEISSIHPDGNK
jgi:predicted dehydrogenase/threonine dehydrogenase-like Zn-dependent dehydrogenase